METKKWKKQRQRHEHAQYNNKICNLIAQHLFRCAECEAHGSVRRCMYRFSASISFSTSLRIAINSMTSATGGPNTTNSISISAQRNTMESFRVLCEPATLRLIFLFSVDKMKFKFKFQIKWCVCVCAQLQFQFAGSTQTLRAVVILTAATIRMIL